MPLLSRVFMALGAVFASLSVVLSATMSHLPSEPASWQPLASSIDQQQFHALGLLVVGWLLGRRFSGWLVAAGVLMLVGMLLFCLNLDAKLLWGWEAARGLVPLGGAAFILSWLALAVGLLLPEN